MLDEPLELGVLLELDEEESLVLLLDDDEAAGAAGTLDEEPDRESVR